MPWLLDHPLASWLVGASVLALLGGELAASYIGQSRDGARRPLGVLLEAVFLVRRRDGAVAQDRWTIWAVIAGSRIGLLGAVLLAALVPAARAGADTWWTLGLGVAMVLAGAALRDWAIVTLGRYFRRQVTIELGQTVIRRGPYRWLRHPAYSGILLAVAGLGLAFGSWFGAALSASIMFAGLLPRIRVEERALEKAFGDDYTDYAASTARLVPRVW